MKIFLAGGFSVSNVKGREELLSKKFPHWKRLFSYYFLDVLHNSQILLIKTKQHESFKK